jgi:hypothetical protein
MGRYRKKPVEIEAVQLTWQTWNDVCAFTGPFPEGMRGVYIDSTGVAHDGHPGGDPRIGLVIPTLEGDHLATEGDWIIRGIQGELYPCKPDIFEATYEPVAE